MTESLPIPVTAPLTRAQRTQLFNLVRRAARAEILPRFRQLDASQIDQKSGPQDLVTEADRAAEAMITRALQMQFPHALIIGEEAASADPTILDKIGEAELCFTIDPVDGTWNFAKGLAVFGVMVSILRFGMPQFGLLYDPIVDEVIWSDIDTPTQLITPKRLSRPVRTSKGGPVEELTGAIPIYLVPEDKRTQISAAQFRFARGVSLRCACHEYWMVAQGRLDFALFCKLTAWDHPAGVLCVRQAGGHAAMLDGSDYRADLTDGHILVASDAATWGRVRDVLDALIETPAQVAS